MNICLDPSGAEKFDIWVVPPAGGASSYSASSAAASLASYLGESPADYTPVSFHGGSSAASPSLTPITDVPSAGLPSFGKPHLHRE